MNTKGRSQLLDVKAAQIVMHGWKTHPIANKGFVAVMIVRSPTEWVICMTEDTGKDYVWEDGSKSLGQFLPGAAFAYCAHRSIENKLPYADLQKVFNETLGQQQGFKLEWLAEEKIG